MNVKLRVNSVNERHVRVVVFTNGINNGQLCFVHKEFRRFLDCLEDADVTFELTKWEQWNGTMER